jgi:hypothetical protein
MSMSSRTLTASARAGLTLLLLGAAYAHGAQAEEDYVKSYTVSGRAHVVVNTYNGRVLIVATDGNQVQLHVHYSGVFWGIGMGERPGTESHQDGDRVEVKVRANWPAMLMGFTSREAMLEVRMPRNADLELDTRDGSADLAALTGDISVHSGNGEITARQLSGRIELSSHDGGITAESLNGELKLQSFNGAIHAAKLAGRCEASTHDGQVHVAGQFAFLDVRSFNGSLAAQIEPGSQISSTWSLTTHDGPVQLALPRDFKAGVDASTHDGRIDLRLPISVSGPVSRSHIHGSLNGGGPDVVIHSFNGHIALAAT